MSKIRVWLGVECDSTALFSRLETQEHGLEKLAQALASSAKDVSLLQDTMRANVSKIASLEAQIAKLRDIQTAKPPKAPIHQARNWSEYKRMAIVAEE